MIPAPFAAVRRRWAGRIAVEPGVHIEVIELFRPQQASERLALDVFRVFRETRRRALGVKLVGFRTAPVEHLIKTVAKQLAIGSGDQAWYGLVRDFWLLAGQAQAQRCASAGSDPQAI